jgi:hypothetical protein
MVISVVLAMLFLLVLASVPQYESYTQGELYPRGPVLQILSFVGIFSLLHPAVQCVLILYSGNAFRWLASRPWSVVPVILAKYATDRGYLKKIWSARARRGIVGKFI